MGVVDLLCLRPMVAVALASLQVAPAALPSPHHPIVSFERTHVLSPRLNTHPHTLYTAHTYQYAPTWTYPATFYLAALS